MNNKYAKYTLLCIYVCKRSSFPSPSRCFVLFLFGFLFGFREDVFSPSFFLFALEDIIRRPMMLLRTSRQLHLLLPQTICHLSSLGRCHYICISSPPLNNFFLKKKSFFLKFSCIFLNFLTLLKLNFMALYLYIFTSFE